MDLSTYLEANKQSDLAKLLGVTPGMVWQWKASVRRVPAERVLQIERATGGKVTRHELRPDLYPIEPDTSERSRAPEAETAQATGGTPACQSPPCIEAAGQEAA